MDLTGAADHWREHGYVILPGYLTEADVADALAVAHGYEDGGRILFPYGARWVGTLAAHPRVVVLAEAVLETSDVRLYGCELFLKRTGDRFWSESLHRDFTDHTPLAPSTDPRFRQVAVSIHLRDVTEATGAERLVSRTLTRGLGAYEEFRHGAPLELTAAEVAATGPAGTVVARDIDTFYRVTPVTEPGGEHVTLRAGYRAATADWTMRPSWDDDDWEEWGDFVKAASVRQLVVFGFPPPGHPYWTPETLAMMASRYRSLDLTPWRADT